jgi:UDP-N-acetylglucosamine 4,6-dehydratase
VSILITGGTGSFGRAMAKRLLEIEGTNHPLNAERIVIFSRNEHAQADMARQLAALDTRHRLRFFIGDVRDKDRLKRAFYGVRHVIHAAALKRIEVGFYNPIEMVKTNIGGAVNVIEAANDCDVEKVVALSTDKAWQPISPYGQSKALAETIFLNSYQGRTICAVCRYGNVWKSAGSVVPKWQEQIAAGAPITMTDADCTRFFMTMDQAVDLVLGTLLTAVGGELRIPTLPAYRLGDLAKAVNAVNIEFTGLPPWEKLHEGMDAGNTSDKARRMSVAELQAHL